MLYQVQLPKLLGSFKWSAFTYVKENKLLLKLSSIVYLLQFTAFLCLPCSVFPSASPSFLCKDVATSCCRAGYHCKTAGTRSARGFQCLAGKEPRLQGNWWHDTEDHSKWLSTHGYLQNVDNQQLQLHCSLGCSDAGKEPAACPCQASCGEWRAGLLEVLFCLSWCEWPRLGGNTVVLCDKHYATNLASSERLHSVSCTPIGAQGCLPSSTPNLPELPCFTVPCPFKGCSGTASAIVKLWSIPAPCRTNYCALPTSQPASAGAMLRSHTRTRAHCKAWFPKASSLSPRRSGAHFHHCFHFVGRVKWSPFSPNLPLALSKHSPCFPCSQTAPAVCAAPQAGQSAHFPLPLMRKKKKARMQAGEKKQRQSGIGISIKHTVMSNIKPNQHKDFRLCKHVFPRVLEGCSGACCWQGLPSPGLPPPTDSSTKPPALPRKFGEPRSDFHLLC